MRKTVVVPTVGAPLLALSAGVASAVTKSGTPGPDAIHGYGGNDEMDGAAAATTSCAAFQFVGDHLNASRPMLGGFSGRVFEALRLSFCFRNNANDGEVLWCFR